MSERRIDRLLIANRGEIAVRIARAAHAEGIFALGIFSEADRDAVHVRAMDEARAIGPAPASESYLDPERIIAAATALHADALHPGYGFLSESAAFARSVEAAGIVFVGPPPEAIAAIGDKIAAKALARANGVPVVPGYDGDDRSDGRLAREARTLGVPLLVKASAGGGGRGMRVVRTLDDFAEALAAARREAAAAFGDDRVFLERAIERPRHVEIQILADAHGHVVALGERECSIQRRHQKIVEESPSTAVSPRLRKAMGDAATRLARAVGYVGAGTVEFLLDETGAFYFLEVNARLQVEHPITEIVYGVDLVREQLRIARGEALGDYARDPRGWAIEARLCAEDPEHDFLPASGTIRRCDLPGGEGIRVDAGVAAGSNVTIYYDSLLAKIVGYGADRATARAHLARALDRTRIAGVATNAPYLAAIVRDSAFEAGGTTTAFLSERGLAIAQAARDGEESALFVAIGALLEDPRTWRVGGVGVPVTLRRGPHAVAIVATRTGAGRWQLDGDRVGEIDVRAENGLWRVERSGAVHSGAVDVHPPDIEVRVGDAVAIFSTEPPQRGEAGARAPSAAGGAIVAPMPGRIAKVCIASGETVRARDLLFVLEAMKMEHRIEAPQAGTLDVVCVAAGTLVSAGEVLAAFANDAGAIGDRP